MAIIAGICYNPATIKNNKEFKYCGENIMSKDSNQDNLIGNAANVVVIKSLNLATENVRTIEVVHFDNNGKLTTTSSSSDYVVQSKMLNHDPVDILGDDFIKVNSNEADS